MKRLIAFFFPFLLSASAFAGAFALGDLVVVRVANGTGALNNQSTATYLDEYTPGGTFVQTVSLPTAASGANLALTLTGNGVNEGYLELSGNGQFLTLAGYNIAPGTATPSSAAASATPRTIGLIKLSNGSVDTRTAINSGTSGNIRSAATLDGAAFWASSSGANVGYLSYGALTAATQLSAAPSNIRVTRILNNQVYISSANTSPPLLGLGTLGTGVPTTSGQTTTELNGFPTTTGPSSYDFFVSGNNAWVCDDRTSGGNGGLQKWTLSGGIWSLQYTIAQSATIGARGLAVDTSTLSGPPTFYVTTTANTIDKVVDGGTLGSSSDTVLVAGVSSGTGAGAFRGIAFCATNAVTAPVARFTGSPTNGAAALAVTFADMSAGTITNWSWTFGDGGATNTTATSVFHTYSTPGTYSVTEIVSGPAGFSTNTLLNYITVLAPAGPVARFTGSPTNGAAALAVTFTDTSTGTITNWSWTFGDGGTTNTTAASVFHTYSTPGTYSVTEIVRGPGGSSTNTLLNYITATNFTGQQVRVMQYNIQSTLGNIANNSSAAAQALARIVNYSQPDILLFCEVTNNNVAGSAGVTADTVALINWVTNNVPHFGSQPGVTFFVAVSSVTSAEIRNAAISRYPILNETTYGDGLRGLHAFTVQLAATNLQIFHTQLKCCSAGTDCATRQTEAELDAAIISAWAATNSIPYLFGGDWNEDEIDGNSECPLTSAYHPITTIRQGCNLAEFIPATLSGSHLTWSTRQTPSIRLDYLLAAANRISPVSGFVFSTANWAAHGLYTNASPQNLVTDSATASDHFCIFADYYFPIPTPTLRASSSGGKVILTWSDARFSVYASPVTIGPKANWTLVAGTSPLNVTPGASQQYYTLKGTFAN